jgi:uncharacterized protein Smg (DUF494 family)
MVNRLMDLVVLVAELSQESNKSLRELDKELLHRGYSSEEIEQALFWMSSQWKPIDQRETGWFDKPVFRVLSPWESMALDSDAHAYLLRLQNLGIIDVDQFEKIMNRIMPFGPDKLSIADLKVLAGSVIFHLTSDDPEDDLFQILDDDILAT